MGIKSIQIDGIGASFEPYEHTYVPPLTTESLAHKHYGTRPCISRRISWYFTASPFIDINDIDEVKEFWNDVNRSTGLFYASRSIETKSAVLEMEEGDILLLDMEIQEIMPTGDDMDMNIVLTYNECVWRPNAKGD